MKRERHRDNNAESYLTRTDCADAIVLPFDSAHPHKFGHSSAGLYAVHVFAGSSRGASLVRCPYEQTQLQHSADALRELVEATERLKQTA